MKNCNSCGELKTLDLFPKDKTKSDGVHTECKKCLAAKARAKRKGIICVKEPAGNDCTCSVCNVTKELNDTNFYVVKSRLSKYDSMCRDCRNAYHRKHRVENKTEEQREKDRLKAKQVHRDMKVKCVEYLGGKCNTCGIAYDGTNAMIFDFHHIDPSKKEFQLLTQRKHSFEHNKPELDKCSLLCANCHRKEHSDTY